MARLPGWLFLVVGAVIVGYAKFIENKRGTDLGFFFWCGILFIAYGVFRELSDRLRRPKKAEKATPPPRREQPQDQRHPAGNQFSGRSPHETHPHVQPAQHPSHPHEPAHKRCMRCHAVNLGMARFCHGCGGAL